jgi:hypothetical protein
VTVMVMVMVMKIQLVELMVTVMVRNVQNDVGINGDGDSRDSTARQVPPPDQ